MDIAPSLLTLRNRADDLAAPADSPAIQSAQSAQQYARRSRAENTLKNYRTAWNVALRCCAAWRESPLPMRPRVAAWIMAYMADDLAAWGWIRSVRTAIRMAHLLSKFPDPTATAEFLLVFEGIARTIGTDPRHQKLALLDEDLRRIHHVANERGLRGAQQWAAISTGYQGAMRRSEVAATDYEDLHFFDDELLIQLDASKTNQYHELEEVHIQRCPEDPELCAVTAVERWLEMTGITSGPVFRRIFPGDKIADTAISARSLCRWVQSYAVSTGHDPQDLGAHSLRAGCVTQLLLNGTDDVVVAERTRHECLESLRPYFRPPRRHAVNVAPALDRHNPIERKAPL